MDGRPRYLPLPIASETSRHAVMDEIDSWEVLALNEIADFLKLMA